MTLDALLVNSEILSPAPSIPVTGLEYDSRKVREGAVFFAFPGEHVDGHRFVPSARAVGAAAIVSERTPPEGDEGVWVQVRHGRRALAAAGLVFYDNPDQRLRLIGITGTNGKTTTAYLSDSILRAAGKTTGLVGTTGYRIGDRWLPAANTTPESLDLVRMLADLEKGSGTHMTLEASSHALELGRISGFQFDTAVFTNLTQDHLDFHGDMEAYFQAKRTLFDGNGPRPRAAVVNADDAYGRRLLGIQGIESLSFSTQGAADIRAIEAESSFDGLKIRVGTPQGDAVLHSPLVGWFNVANILAAVGVGLTQEIDLMKIAQGIEECGAVPGRFEIVREGQPFLVAVDYAHTDDALRNLISAARRLVPTGGCILTVFGCGGDRDRAKRPLMGAAAGELSDRVILTSDNPRSEDPLRILADAEVGLQRVDANYVREPDRRKAIAKALNEAAAGDIVLIAGKGHETYQKIGDEKLPFDDRETARELLRDITHGRRAG
ncbi:MAG: UDP-N-acetylmuramoyl-L-alanyl-D-glutamate--2,6-diaminopimelate ligase [Acidobacteria bacterium]|nr:UDP-N-acetylmuramoyl-L-alanyl-D-glutamate--2,6-diaminopimelate ligase [Acidobacteriota bacterium]